MRGERILNQKSEGVLYGGLKGRARYQDVQLMLMLVPKVVKGLWGTISR